jgi:hypothetical protein
LLIKNGVENLAKVCHSRTTARRKNDERMKELPLSVSQVGWKFWCCEADMREKGKLKLMSFDNNKRRTRIIEE